MDVWEDEVRQVASLDDESIPAESQEEAPNLPTCLPLPLSSLDPRLAVQSVTCPGSALESRSTKEPRAGRGEKPDVNLEVYGIFSSGEDNIRSALVPDDAQNAIRLLTAGCPNYRVLHGRDPPAPLAHEDLRTELGRKTTYNQSPRSNGS